MPKKGDSLSRIATWISFFLADSAAFWMAGVTLDTEVEPPEVGAGGSAESPSSVRILSIGISRQSAPTIARTVQVPVPRSWVADETWAVPSACNRTLAEARLRWAG